MRSRIYAGQLRHRRFGERAYQFTYSVFYLYIDLDEIAEVDRRIRLLSYNRLNVLSLLDRDHMGGDGQGIAEAAYARLRLRGIELGDGSVGLVTNPRIMNYVFNPVSFFLVRDDAGDLRHMLAEVHNTHGERHVYDLEREPGEAGVYRAKADKVFYVSPFIDMEARYEFTCRQRDGGLDVRIEEFQRDEMFFQADLRLASLPLTNANVVKMLARYPFMTAKTIGLIHWQGLKLWLRGERFRPNSRKEAVR